MAEPTLCCVRAGSYCARVDTLFNLPGVHVLDVTWRERAGRIPAGLRTAGGDRPGRDRLPGLRGDRDRARTPTPQAARHPCLRCPGRAGVAATPLPLPRAGLPVGGFSEDHLPGRAADEADDAGGVVGDQLHPTRHCLGGGAVARRLGVDWHTVWDAIAPLLRRAGRRPRSTHRGRHSRRRRAHLAPSGHARGKDRRNSPGSWT